MYPALVIEQSAYGRRRLELQSGSRYLVTLTPYGPSFSPIDAHIVSDSGDRTICLWDADLAVREFHISTTKRPVASWIRHERTARHAALRPRRRSTAFARWFGETLTEALILRRNHSSKRLDRRSKRRASTMDSSSPPGASTRPRAPITFFHRESCHRARFSKIHVRIMDTVLGLSYSIATHMNEVASYAIVGSFQYQVFFRCPYQISMYMLSVSALSFMVRRIVLVVTCIMCFDLRSGWRARMRLQS